MLKYIRENKLFVASLGVLLVLYIMYSNPFGIISGIYSLVYQETDISNDVILSDLSRLKDFEVQDDGSIVSTSEEAYLDIYYADYDLGNPKVMDIVLDFDSDFGESADIYGLDECLDTKSKDLNPGKNYVNLSFTTEQDTGLRLCLTKQEGTIIKIKEIRFNESNYLARRLSSKIKKFFLPLILFIVLWRVQHVFTMWGYRRS
jgi:hypothetical protein